METAELLTRTKNPLIYFMKRNSELNTERALMLDALQRITHPAADDTDLENALQVIAQATQEPKQ